MADDERRTLPLPADTRALLAQRKHGLLRNLNDEVEPIFVGLFEEPGFQRYLNAVYDEQAIEGSLATDNVMAAELIRNAAQEAGNGFVADQKLHTLVKAMNIVKRRLQVHPMQRRYSVHGEQVEPGSSDNS